MRGLSGQRWSDGEAHELYCAGHLFQAAVAHHRVTGSDRALGISRRFADLICATFGEGRGKLDRPDGHPEIEMALVELYRETGEARYLEQACVPGREVPRLRPPRSQRVDDRLDRRVNRVPLLLRDRGRGGLECRRVELPHQLADGHAIERRRRTDVELLDQLADCGALAFSGLRFEIGKRAFRPFHFHHHFFDGDSIGIAAGHEPGPVAADFFHQLRVFELAQDAHHLRIGRAELLGQSIRRRRIFTSIVIPATVPFIATGVRLALGRLLIGVVVAELYAQTQGIGVMLDRAADTLQSDVMMFGVLLFTLMGVITTTLAGSIERRFQRWRPSANVDLEEGA